MRASIGRSGLAALLTAGAVAAAVLTPASAEAAGSSRVTGVVTVDGHALAGVAAGTWSAARRVVTRGRTDSRGRFVLHSPRGLAVEARSGVAPSSPHAVFTTGDRHLVRGVVGDAQPEGLASPL